MAITSKRELNRLLELYKQKKKSKEELPAKDIERAREYFSTGKSSDPYTSRAIELSKQSRDKYQEPIQQNSYQQQIEPNNYKQVIEEQKYLQRPIEPQFDQYRTDTTTSGSTKPRVEDLRETTRKIPERIGEGLAVVGEKVGGMIGEVAGRGVGFATGATIGATEADISGSNPFEKIKMAYKQAKKTSLETGGFGRSVVGGVFSGALRFLPDAVQTVTDLSIATKNSIRGKEDDILDYAADEFIKVYNADLGDLSSAFGVTPGQKITKDDAKSYLKYGNFDNDPDNIDSSEVFKAWAASMASTGIDLYFLSDIAAGTLDGIIKEAGKKKLIIGQQNAIKESVMLDKLDLKPGASKTQIKEAYLKKARQHHPDKFTDPVKKAANEKIFKEANTAYQYLKKEYQPAPRVEQRPATTAKNAKQIEALDSLGLKWGDSRTQISKRYNELVKSGRITDAQKKAFNELMYGENKYNPYAEADAFMKAQKEKFEKKHGDETRQVQLYEPIELPERSPMMNTAKQLPAATRGVDIPPIDTSQAAFQIVDPNKKKRLETLKSKLQDLVEKKQKAIDSGRAGADVKKETERIQTFIDKINKTISTTEKESIIKTGPIKKTPTNVYYHGTTSDFDSFDPSKLGEATGASDSSLGFHFTSNKNIADAFGDKVKEVTLDIKRPFDLWKDFVGNDSKYNELYRLINGARNGIDYSEFVDIMNDGLAFDNKAFKELLLDKDVISNIKEAGYDSIILPHTTEDILLAKANGATDVKGVEVIPLDTKAIRPIVRPGSPNIMRGVSTKKDTKTVKTSSPKRTEERTVASRDSKKIEPTPRKHVTEVKRTTPSKTETIKKELAKMKREGKDIGAFADKAVNAWLDFLEGKTKKDYSPIIDDFINEEFINKAEQYYTRRDSSVKKPEYRKLKVPTKSMFSDIISRRKAFKVYEEMQKIVNKYAKLVSEKNVGRGREGVYRQRTGNIAVRSLNNIYTTTHEVAHSLDMALGIVDKIIADKNGRVMSSLLDIYKKYYPGSKKDTMETMLREGFATLIERNALEPKKTAEDYPLLVEQIIRSTGQYYNKVLGEAIRDVDRVVSEYVNLSAMEQEKSKIVFDKRKLSDKKTFNIEDNFITQNLDYIRPLEKLAIKNNIPKTENDPSTLFRLIPSVTKIGISNITAPKDYYKIDKEGTPIKEFDFNWRTLASDIGRTGRYKDYSTYLAVRRPYYIQKKVTELEAKTNRTGKEEIALEKAKKILEKSKLDMDNVKRIVEDNKDEFKDFDSEFDAMAASPVKVLRDSGLISEEFANDLLTTKGYARLARSIIDEIEGEKIDSSFSRDNLTSRPGSFIEYKGSEKPSLDPFTSTAKAGAYINEKVIMQSVLEKLYELESFGEINIISKRKIKPEEMTFFPKRNGNNIEFKYGDEWIEMQISNKLRDVFETSRQMKERDGTRQLVKSASNLFVQSTTGLAYPAFAFVNVLIDWVPAWAQTQNGIIPVMTGLTAMSKALAGKYSNSSIIKKIIGDTASKELAKERARWETYKRSGALDYAMISMFEENPAKMLREMRVGDDSFVKYMGITSDFVINGLTYLSKRTEALNRYGEYTKALDAGKPHAVALEEANRITAAFSHKGKMLNRTLRTFEDSLVYANSVKQYMYSAVKAIRDKETRKRAIGVHLMTAGVSLAGYLYMLHNLRDKIENGTEEEKEDAKALLYEYQNQNMYGLSNHIYTFIPGRDHLSKTRIAGNYNDVGTVLTMALSERMLGKDYSWKDYLGVLKDLYVPSQYDITEPKDMAGNLIPQIAKGSFEVAFNVKTFPEVKALESEYIKNKPSEERYYPWTNDLAIWLGQTDLMKSQNISPIQIEQFLKSQGGRGLDAITKYLDEGMLKGPLKGEAETFKKIFQNETYMFTGVGYEKFYEDAKKSASEYTKLRKGTDRNAIAERKRINTLYVKVSDQLREIRKINSDEDITIPKKIPNKLYEIIEQLNKGDYDEAEKKFREDSYIVDYFIKNNKKE